MSEGFAIASVRNIDDDRTVDVDLDGGRLVLSIVKDGAGQQALSASLRPEAAEQLINAMAMAIYPQRWAAGLDEPYPCDHCDDRDAEPGRRFCAVCEGL